MRECFSGVDFSIGLLTASTLFNRQALNSNNGEFRPTKALCVQDEMILTMLTQERRRDGDGASFVVTDPSIKDNPIIYSSPAFCKLTGYSKAEVEMRNCRFLQGEQTNLEEVEKIREAVKNNKPTSVCLLNYRKDGTTFVNNFFIAPLHDDDGVVAYYIGVQQNILSFEDYHARRNPGCKISDFLN